MGKYVSTIDSVTYAMKGGVTDYTPSFFWMARPGKPGAYSDEMDKDDYVKLKAKNAKKTLGEKAPDYFAGGDAGEYTSLFKNAFLRKEYGKD